MTTDKKTKEDGDRTSKEKSPKPKESIKENGTKVEKKAPKSGGGSGLMSKLTTLALIGIIVALVVTVHKLNTQIASDKKLYIKQLQELEADASSSNTKATVAESQKLEALSKVNALENQVKEAQEEANTAVRAKRATERTIEEVEVLKKKQGIKLEQAEKKALKLQEELSNTKNSLEKSQASKQDLIKRNVDLQGRIKEKEEQLKLQEEYSRKASDNLASFKRKEAFAQKEIVSLKNDLKTAQELLDKKTNEVDNAKAEVEGKDSENAKLKASLQKAEVEVAAIKGVLKTNQDAIDAAASSYANLEKTTGEEIKKLRSDIAKMTNDDGEKGRRLQEIEENARQWEVFGREKAQAEADLTEQKNNLLNQIQELQGKIALDENSLKEKDSIVNEKLNQLAQREQQINNFQSEVDILKRTITERDATVLDIQNKWNDANAQVAQLQQQLQAKGVPQQTQDAPKA